VFTKGFLLGIAFAVISVYLLFWFLRSQAPVPSSAAVSFDLRALRPVAVRFFGAMSLGFALVLGGISAGFYGLWLFVMRQAQQLH